MFKKLRYRYRRLNIWLLRLEIASAERYVEHARNGHVMTEDQLDELRRNVNVMRVRLAIMQGENAS